MCHPSWGGSVVAESWKERALCRPEHAALMTADSMPKAHAITQLGLVCAACPVARECAADAVTKNPLGFRAGVWIHDRGPQRQVSLHVLMRKAGMR